MKPNGCKITSRRIALRCQGSDPSRPLFCPHVQQRETLQKYLQKASKPVHFLKSATLGLSHHLELQCFYKSWHFAGCIVAWIYLLLVIFSVCLYFIFNILLKPNQAELGVLTEMVKVKATKTHSNNNYNPYIQTFKYLNVILSIILTCA